MLRKKPLKKTFVVQTAHRPTKAEMAGHGTRNHAENNIKRILITISHSNYRDISNVIGSETKFHFTTDRSIDCAILHTSECTGEVISKQHESELYFRTLK